MLPSEVMAFISVEGSFDSLTPIPLLRVGNRPFIRRIIEHLPRRIPLTILSSEEDRPALKWELRDVPHVDYATVLKETKEEYLMMWDGSVLINSDVDDLLEKAQEHDVTLVTHPDARSNFDNCVGVAIMRTDVVNPYLLKMGTKFSERVFPAMRKDGKKFLDYPVEKYIDISNPPRYKEVRIAAENGGIWT